MPISNDRASRRTPCGRTRTPRAGDRDATKPPRPSWAGLGWAGAFSRLLIRRYAVMKSMNNIAMLCCISFSTENGYCASWLCGPLNIWHPTGVLGEYPC
jgi:hypothetical protein